MKTASDVMLNKIIQRIKNLIDGKADADHSHDGVYSNGARRTLNQQLEASSFVTSDNTEKWFIVLIGRYSEHTQQDYATIYVDWQMIPSGEDGLSFYYNLNGSSLNTDSSTTDGFLLVTKDSDGCVTFSLSDASSHCIRHVCGYV